MDAGKLKTRVKIVRITKNPDGYGGSISSESTVATIWANKVEVSGDIGYGDGQRRHYIQSDFIVRKKTAELIQPNYILQVEGETNKYRYNNYFESVDDFYIKIRATKIER